MQITANGRKVFGGLTQGKMMSVPISKSLHQVITNRWRNVFANGYKYNTITKKEMQDAIKEVYKDMPALKAYALMYLNEVWK